MDRRDLGVGFYIHLKIEGWEVEDDKRTGKL